MNIAPMYLSILLLMDIWVVSSLGLLGIVMHTLVSYVYGNHLPPDYALAFSLSNMSFDEEFINFNEVQYI